MKVIDIRPDPSLRKSNFDGYKLSLEAVPILKLENIPAPHQQLRDLSSEYSFIHSSLFQLHNHLISDPWLSYTAYYIDTSYTIQKLSYEVSFGKLKQLTTVYKFKVDKDPSKSSGFYNCDLRFISEKFALLSDGVGSLKILETGDRQRSDEWKCIQSLNPIKIDSGFIIQDAKFLIDNGERMIHCLLLHIKQDEGKFFNVIEWLTLKQVDGNKNWEVYAQRTIEGRGNLYYLSLDPKCKGLVYSSNKVYKFVYDSINEVIEKIDRTDITNDAMDTSENVADFKWTQNSEDISVYIKREEDSTKDQFQVKSLGNHLEVTFKDKFLIKSDLFGEINVDMTNWILENDHLQVNLVKKDSTLIWPFLTPGGPPMENNETTNPFASPIADLNSQMEECDFGFEGDDDFYLDRLDAISHEISHRVFLSSNYPLLSLTLRPGHPKAIGLRNDVDCCLWLQQMNANDEWSLKHESTLHAFGYVQASKQGRKYLACSPDTNLSVISEANRHLFIYNKNYSSAKGLRNRNGPQMTVGQQKVVTLSNDEIIGIYVEDDIIIILTETSISCLQLGIEE